MASVAFEVVKKSSVQRAARASNWDAVREQLRTLSDDEYLKLDGKQYRAKSVRQSLYKNTGGDYKVSVSTDVDGNLILAKVPLDAVPQAQ